MKKMYKKPISETHLIKTDEMMEPTLGVSGGGTEQLGSGMEGNAPQRRSEVF